MEKQIVWKVSPAFVFLILPLVCDQVDGKVRGYVRCSNQAKRSSRARTDIAVDISQARDTPNSPCTSDVIEQNCCGLADCQQIFDHGCNKSDIYHIQPADWTGPPFDVYCNMTSLEVDTGTKNCQGGNWIVIQRRVNGSVDFHRDWSSYKEGFGQLDHEFWLGNEKLHYLTKQGGYELRVDLLSKSLNPFFACYQDFHIDNETSDYKLRINVFSGTAGDSLSISNGQAFSTFDAGVCVTCANTNRGGWWWKAFATPQPNLNGDYRSIQGTSNIRWPSVPGPGEGDRLKFLEMKIRKKMGN